jgi:hypothetical protein
MESEEHEVLTRDMVGFRKEVPVVGNETWWDFLAGLPGSASCLGGGGGERTGEWIDTWASKLP